MTTSISKIIADSEESLLASQRTGANLAETLNKILATHLGWPYQVRAGDATDADGVKTGVFPTLIFTGTEAQSPTEPVSVSAESLACVVEVIGKLDLDSLNSAYERIVVAKSLRKTKGPPSPYLNTTFGTIFALEAALPLEIVGNKLGELNKTHPSYLWPDMVGCILVRRFAAGFGAEPGSGSVWICTDSL